MTAGEYQRNVLDNIILELNDDAPESKLLGIQVDMIWKIRTNRQVIYNRIVIHLVKNRKRTAI